MYIRRTSTQAKLPDARPGQRYGLTFAITLSGKTPGCHVNRQSSFSLMHDPSDAAGGEEARHTKPEYVFQIPAHLRAFPALHRRL
ncbi:hypothetical protein IAQ61_007236 [Plenodomus lingam]|nr:hypothetical protein IAQ61_007236 [Plenodomus lingam]